ncbi:histidine kinase [Clostridium carboxidivorans P7]|uniref:histidine kinase n=1 Tax=Clostridium carboxidivorans P7 TaxID=536227 RepID=C6PYH3_9CLOT|nr:HAMP domain-containing sensor histidine kinase [Clostridium carboxidivorans]AKN29724.1 histidine kinase [Clostridium carboxidivorans P7]EET85692.1 histidine kinase [Clostridium carboxidivorans P7]EFG89333.1 ATPase, histidine kinase-, DNA gyrase B-, and HSP90-like domain protein [Clostridium carboxidivorans P7]
MKNSVRFKFMLGLSIIFIVAAVVLNLLIRQVFENNLENSIKSSMKDTMKSSREYIKYNMLPKDLYMEEEALCEKLWSILNGYIFTRNYEMEIRTPSGKIKANTISSDFTGLTDRGTKEALKGKAVINLQYSKDNVQAVLSYPLYDGNRCLGILNISKSFSDSYIENKRIINIITLIELFVFIFVFTASYLFTSRIVQPIITLTKQIKKIEEGDYEINLNIRNNDEIGILLKEFINMKEKIRNQIETISMEKDKVLNLEKGRREFFNNVTHELKTPLTAISGYAQILSDKNVKDEEFKTRAIQRIYLESERLHKLVINLINASKEIDFQEEHKESIEMKTLLNDVCIDMASKAEKYSIHILTNLEQGFIFGQENKIRQLIINLLDNAIKYSFSGENINVNAFKGNDHYKIEILNKGNPIPERTYSSIFEPFVKGINSIEGGSSGLGLYICSEIVKEHNGEIHIENGNIIKVIIKIPSFSSGGNNLETT